MFILDHLIFLLGDRLVLNILFKMDMVHNLSLILAQEVLKDLEDLVWLHHLSILAHSIMHNNKELNNSKHNKRLQQLNTSNNSTSNNSSSNSSNNNNNNSNNNNSNNNILNHLNRDLMDLLLNLARIVRDLRVLKVFTNVERLQ